MITEFGSTPLQLLAQASTFPFESWKRQSCLRKRKVAHHASASASVRERKVAHHASVDVVGKSLLREQSALVENFASALVLEGEIAFSEASAGYEWFTRTKYCIN